MTPPKQCYLVATDDMFFEPDRFAQSAPALLPMFQTLWSAALLRGAEAAPQIRTPANPPLGEHWLAVAPESLREEIATRQEWQNGRVVYGKTTDRGAFARQLEIPAEFDDLDRDLFALGLARLGLHALMLHLRHDTHFDDWAMLDALRFALDEKDAERRRDHFVTAFETLHNARSLAFPAGIHLLEIALWPGEPPADFADRLARRTPINLSMNGRALAELAKLYPVSAQTLNAAVESGSAEILGGPYDDRPWAVLPFECRCWQLRRSTQTHRDVVGKRMDTFAARHAVLGPMTPQLAMKYQFKNAIHAAFDGSKLPKFKKPKVNWNGADNSSVEALTRSAWDAGDENSFLGALARLGKALEEDRGPTLPFAHWCGRSAVWFDDWIRAHDFAPVLGRFETASDYFANSAYSDATVHTYADEYRSNALERPTDNPISAPAAAVNKRADFDAVAALVALAQLATEAASNRASALDELEERLETGVWTDAERQRLNELRTEALAALAGGAIDSKAGGRGWFVVNPSSFARRVAVTLPRDARVGGSALRGAQSTDSGVCVLVDVPGWGWSYLAESATNARSDASIVRGRKLVNEYIEVEIDAGTGGIRGLWDLRTGFSRLGQQLVHSGGSRMVCRSRTTTADGGAFGEIETSGDVLTRNGKERLAKYRQRVRLWRGKPTVDVDIRIEPVKTPNGERDEDYFGCRWAWPDEKAVVSVADGLTLFSHRGGRIEAPLLIDLRERKFLTTILTRGHAFAVRPEARMADSLLVVQGESARDFAFSVAVNFARPVAAALDALTPAFAVPCEGAPPNRATSGVWASLSLANVVASALRPVDEHRVLLRAVDAVGKAGRAELRFHKQPLGLRLVNGLGELIFDLYPSDGAWALDFAPNELQMVEIQTSRPPPAAEPAATEADDAEEDATDDEAGYED